MNPEEEQAGRILKACPGMTVRTARGLAGVWIEIPLMREFLRMRATRRVYDAFPPGYTFLIHFSLVGGGGANQPFVTGKDSFPTTYNWKKVRSYHRETLVYGPDTLLRLLVNLNQLPQ